MILPFTHYWPILLFYLNIHLDLKPSQGIKATVSGPHLPILSNDQNYKAVSLLFLLVFLTAIQSDTKLFFGPLKH
jgi:hypothetical protein